MKLSLHRADDFNTDFDLQYRWYLEHANESVAERYLIGCGQRCNCSPPNPTWGVAESFVIPRSVTFARFDWLLHLGFT